LDPKLTELPKLRSDIDARQLWYDSEAERERLAAEALAEAKRQASREAQVRLAARFITPFPGPGTFEIWGHVWKFANAVVTCQSGPIFTGFTAKFETGSMFEVGAVLLSFTGPEHCPESLFGAVTEAAVDVQFLGVRAGSNQRYHSLVRGFTPEDNTTFVLEGVDVAQGRATGQFPPAVAVLLAALAAHWPTVKKSVLSDIDLLRQHVWKVIELERLKKKNPNSCRNCNIGGANIRYCWDCDSFYCSNTFRCHMGFYAYQCFVCKSPKTTSCPSSPNDFNVHDAKLWGKDNREVNHMANRETPAWASWVLQLK
jgi:hypothetical protein